MVLPTDLIAPMLMPLRDMIDTMPPADYGRPISTLHEASIGAHVRHILDMYGCLERGVANCIVNYEGRSRDERIEKDPDYAIAVMDGIITGLRKDDGPLMVEGNYSASGEDSILVATSYQREVLYNLEHTIHHMAMIRIAIEAMGKIHLPETFGVAPSTIKFKGTCAR